MEPCCGDPPGRCRTDTRLLVAVAPGARMRALQWRAGTTLRVWTPPLPGPRGTRWSPYFLFFINFLILPQNLFQTCTYLKPPMSLPLRENSSQKTCPLLSLCWQLPDLLFWLRFFHLCHLDVPEAQNFLCQNQTPLSSQTSSLSLLYLNERHSTIHSGVKPEIHPYLFPPTFSKSNQLSSISLSCLLFQSIHIFSFDYCCPSPSSLY